MFDVRNLSGLVLLAAVPVHAVNLLQVLQNYSELSSLSGYINSSPIATVFLETVNNFTFLAPSNAAIEKYVLNNAAALPEDLLLATLEYSMLQGGYPTLSFTITPQFVHSSLVNTTYSNVTGGQTVELLQSSAGALEIFSANKTISTVTTSDLICSGGIIHIVDTIPSIPTTVVSEITTANLEYAVSILSTGNYLNNASNFYVENILETSNVTYFIPNSASALSDLSQSMKNASAAEMQAIFDYHVVPGLVAYSTVLSNGMSLKTAQGENVTISVRDGVTYVNAARIIASDYMVANGIMHVIDNLLNLTDTAPPSFSQPSFLPESHSQSQQSRPTTKTVVAIAVSVGGGVVAILAIMLYLVLRRAHKINVASASYNSKTLSCTSSTRSGHTCPSHCSYNTEKTRKVFLHKGTSAGDGDKDSGWGTGWVVQPFKIKTSGGIGKWVEDGKRESNFAGPPYVPAKSPRRPVRPKEEDDGGFI